jgi:hypothetical protein
VSRRKQDPPSPRLPHLFSATLVSVSLSLSLCLSLSVSVSPQILSELEKCIFQQRDMFAALPCEVEAKVNYAIDGRTGEMVIL